jgi:hypothetical protein
MSIRSRIVAGVLPTVTSAIIALLPSTAFASDPTTKPIYYYEIFLEATAGNPAECREAVAVRLEPVDIRAHRAGSLYQRRTYTDQPVIVGKPIEDGPGNWECWFTYRTRDLAPGPGDGCVEYSSRNH